MVRCAAVTLQHGSIYDPLAAENGQYKYVRVTSKNNESILNNEGRPILTREYQFNRADSSIIVIQDYSAGHRFSAPGNAGDQPAHLNLRPIENTRNGKVDGARDHYYFRGGK